MMRKPVWLGIYGSSWCVYVAKCLARLNGCKSFPGWVSMPLLGVCERRSVSIDCTDAQARLARYLRLYLVCASSNVSLDCNDAQACLAGYLRLFLVCVCSEVSR